MKRAALLAALTLCLCACAVTDSASLNSQSAREYRSIVAAAAQKGQIDTQSPTAQRIHAVFRRLVPHADAANRTGTSPSNGNSPSSAAKKSTHGPCPAAKWQCTPAWSNSPT
uniref:Lipoprotein n=1 Tax=Conchiformibius kuhniae TaxID=211502 RepID=A0A8T9MX89_9NEIS|nr:hypothetical protein LVJ77_11685 [Conchiformibius kuhniae]